MTDINCEILDVITRGDNKYFRVYSIDEDKTYTIPTEQLVKYNIRVGEKYLFQKKQNRNSQKYYLEYIYHESLEKQIITHRYYECNKIYEFKIDKFATQLNKKKEAIPIILVEDIDKNIIKVLALKWQKEEIWNFNTLMCEVEKFWDNGIPKLINKDFRHPFYTINEEYEFKIIGEKSKITDNGTINLFELQGEDNCIHEVSVFPGQKFNQYELEKVQCKVLNITTHLRLSQRNIKDPFYVTFDKIVNDKYLENYYFVNLLEEIKSTNKDAAQTLEQYNEKRAFWVITYANKVLPKLFRESIDRLDYKQAKEVIQLVIKFEEWIIAKGIITSLPDEDIRASTTLKAKRQLESARIEDTILSILITNPYNFLREELFFTEGKNLIARFYYLVNFSNIRIIDPTLFIYRLQQVLKHNDINLESELYYLSNLLNYIHSHKKAFISEKEKEYFSLSSPKIGETIFTENESKYLIWSYGEILLAQLLNRNDHLNILCGQLLKIFTKSTLEVDKKECLLFNAYKYFENYQSLELNIPFQFNNQLSINYDVLETNISNPNSNTENWNELENSFANNISFSVRLTKKSKSGYEANYKNLKGFLPYHHIKDNRL